MGLFGFCREGSLEENLWVPTQPTIWKSRAPAVFLHQLLSQLRGLCCFRPITSRLQLLQASRWQRKDTFPQEPQHFQAHWPNVLLIFLSENEQLPNSSHEMSMILIKPHRWNTQKTIEWRNNSRKNEEMEPKQKKTPRYRCDSWWK